MIREISDKDIVKFAKAGVEFSKTYPLGITKFLDSELQYLDLHKNFFFLRGGDMQCFVYEENGKIKGRIAAIINPDLRDNGEKVGLVGLFDCENNFEIASQLFDSAISCLRAEGCRQVWGPIDFSIWHHYRLMSKGFDRHPFYGEPRNPPYYQELFEQYGFSIKTKWESQVMDMKGMELFYDHNKDQLELFYRLNYSFERLNKHNTDHMMDISYQLIMQTYRQFPGFSNISQKEFRTHFKRLPALLDRDCTLFVKNPDGEYVGFLLVFRDIAKAVQAMNGKTGLHSKVKFMLKQHMGSMANIAQGAALPQYIREAAVLGRKKMNQPLTLAGATICQAIKNIMDTGRYTHTVISLMREGAQIRNHANHESTETREYLLYKMSLK